jgi:hypothetical protein
MDHKMQAVGSSSQPELENAENREPKTWENQRKLMNETVELLQWLPVSPETATSFSDSSELR